MIAKERACKVRGAMSALAVLSLVGSVNPVLAQSNPPANSRTPVPAAKSAQPKANAPVQPSYDPTQPGQLQFEAKVLPTNPNDPIAIINEEVITRRQLADECVARKGEEILETLIARKLIEQALKTNKLKVTAAEIDAEIDNVAMNVGGISREAWLRTLDKERGISPIQYARDIIYPGLALKKLAAPMVQVTPKDIQEAFEAQYGDKLRCRMIMVDKVQKAKEIWDELRKNPGGFEKIAMERSMDSGSRSLGGLLAEPISRHAYPQNVSDAAFKQLVDGDPTDKNASHKPTNGAITGPIEVAEATWIILRREEVIPAKPVDPKDPAVKKSTHDMIYEVKLKEKMGQYMELQMQAAQIDNRLTGQVKEANETLGVDKDIKLMSNGQPATGNDSPAPAAGTPTPKQKLPLPAALSPEVAKQAEGLTKPTQK